MMLMLIKLYPLPNRHVKIEVMTASCPQIPLKLMLLKGLATKRQKILMMMKLCQNMKKIDSGAFVEIKSFWQPLV